MNRLLCWLGLHKFEVIREEDVKCFDEPVGKAIVSRCTCCGKIKVVKYSTTVNSENVQWYYRKN